MKKISNSSHCNLKKTSLPHTKQKNARQESTNISEKRDNELTNIQHFNVNVKDICNIARNVFESEINKIYAC